MSRSAHILNPNLKPKDAGFTLVEVLISLFIFAIISAGTMSVLTTSLRGKTQMDERISDMQNIETMRAIIKNDMANVILRPSRDVLGGEGLYTFSGGLEDLVSFTRGGRSNPGGLEPRGDMQRVTYLFEQGQLIRRHLAHENPAPNTPEFDRIMLSGIDSMAVKFIADEVEGTQVFIEPNMLATIHAVKFELTFENGDKLDQYFELGL
ncbi:MAG: type II secretion system minor pseudopilin GspJ [Litorimonas sp.]